MEITAHCWSDYRYFIQVGQILRLIYLSVCLKKSSISLKVTVFTLMYELLEDHWLLFHHLTEMIIATEPCCLNKSSSILLPHSRY